MEHICIITSRYPTSIDPTAMAFVQQFASGMAEQGKKVSVICPLPVNINIKYTKIAKYNIETTPEGNPIQLYFPKFVGFGQRYIGSFNTAGMTTTFFTAAVRKVLKKMQEKPNVLYGHFITPAGLCACKLGKEYKIPCFIAYGEDHPWSIEHIGCKKVKSEIAHVNGIISVSGKNSADLVNLNVAKPQMIEVFPNGYNPKLFQKKDKLSSRKQFGFNEDDFIVGFVGSFDDRKGILRLQEAIDRIGGIKFACAGKGKLMPTSDNCIYAAPVKHDLLATFNNACDIFVLPTRMEGCCNAIVEAVACGLPIVSSDRLFNNDILDETNSIRIDPDSVDQIEAAIRKLKDDPKLREKLAEGSLEKAKSLTLEQRAKNILRFMEERL